MKKTIDIECESCSGTGLYSGMCEAKGIAVVCVRCDGTGCQKFSYIPFTCRKGKRGIHTVTLSRGQTMIAGCGPGGKPITYREFESGKMPSV